MTHPPPARPTASSPTAEPRFASARFTPQATPPPRPRSGPTARLRTPTLAALLTLASACGHDDAGAPATIEPEMIGTAALPLSESERVALLADERTACVVDSYESQVRCVDVDGAVVGVFGGTGEGPGEFGRPSGLTRGEDGTVGVSDPELGRFTIFEPSGAYVSDVTVAASLFAPLRSFGSILSGVSVDIAAMLGGGTSGSLMTRIDVEVASGEVVREEGSPRGPWDVECGEVTYGIPDRAEGWVFVACEGHLVFVGNEGDATVLRAPMYLPELPDERDVARREAELTAMLQGRGLGAAAASQSVAEGLETYRAAPKHYFLSTADQLFDAGNRYWIATQRDTHDWSYLDVYENAQYVGSVRIRDRLRAFDLLGSTLVALVDRKVGADDSDGFPDRALDWYDIGDLRLGR